MNIRVQTLTTLLMLVVIFLVGFSGCGLMTKKVKIGWEPSGHSEVLVDLLRDPILHVDNNHLIDWEVSKSWTYPQLSREFSDHLNKVNKDGNDPCSNPNYWQEMYDLIDEYLGIDTESTVRFIVEHGIYTEAILKYLDDYEAFRYIISYSPMSSYKTEVAVTEYAQRIVANEPESLKGLEAGLYLARCKEGEDDIVEPQAAYLSVLRHHPNSIDALFKAAFWLDAPEAVIPLLQKANRLAPTFFNYHLGVQYELMGDYKTAWVYYRKEMEFGNTYYTRRAERNLRALEVKKQPLPSISTSTVDPLSMSLAELADFVTWAKSAQNMEENNPIDINSPYLERVVRFHLYGEKIAVDPSRLARAFEYIYRHGKEAGIKRLEQTDSKLANKVKSMRR